VAQTKEGNVGDLYGVLVAVTPSFVWAGKLPVQLNWFNFKKILNISNCCKCSLIFLDYLLFLLLFEKKKRWSMRLMEFFRLPGRE